MKHYKLIKTTVSVIFIHTVFSPEHRSSTLISENNINDGSARSDIIFNVSPSILLIEMVLSSEPSAKRFSEFHIPHIIAFECLPRAGIRL